MDLLSGLIDARRIEEGEEPLSEAFSAALHPRSLHGPHGGEFTRKLGSIGPRASAAPSAPAAPLRKVGPPEKPAVPEKLRGRTGLSGKRYGAEPAQQRVKPTKLGEKALPGAVGSGSWEKAVPKTVKALQSGAVADTEQAYRIKGADGKLGAYTPERIELHARIAKLLLQHADTHSKPEAHFLAGGPASGKSSLIKVGKVKLPGDVVDVNPDIVRTMLPEYDALLKAGDKMASSKTHEEASHISKVVMNLALARKHHVVVDGVGNSGPGKFAGKIMAAHNAGHQVHVTYATIDTEEALKRANVRGEKTGRFVPAGFLRASHRDVSARFLADVQHLPVHKIEVHDTSTRKTALLFRKLGTTQGQIADRKGFERFTRKAKENASA